MQEITHIYDGKGILHLRGGPLETVLYVKKEPRIMCFYAEHESTFRFHLGRAINERIVRDNYQYEQLVKEGNVDPNENLNDQFGHILRLLTNGSYQLQLGEISHEYGLNQANDASGNNTPPGKWYGWYGGFGSPSCTHNHQDPALVEDYKKSIQNGARPIVILLKIADSFERFIIDGHHKMHAYKELKRNPRILTISKIDTKALSLDEGLAILDQLQIKDQNCLDRYQEEKKEGHFLSNYHQFYVKENHGFGI